MQLHGTCIKYTLSLMYAYICTYIDGHVVLESVRHPGQHVGVRESGEVKKPSNTGKGKHGQFTPIVTGIYMEPLESRHHVLKCPDFRAWETWEMWVGLFIEVSLSHSFYIAVVCK